jgi:hypothetical protein
MIALEQAGGAEGTTTTMTEGKNFYLFASALMRKTYQANGKLASTTFLWIFIEASEKSFALFSCFIIPFPPLAFIIRRRRKSIRGGRRLK